jgi:hypothetical protein
MELALSVDLEGIALAPLAISEQLVDEGEDATEAREVFAFGEGVFADGGFFVEAKLAGFAGDVCHSAGEGLCLGLFRLVEGFGQLLLVFLHQLLLLDLRLFEKEIVFVALLPRIL